MKYEAKEIIDTWWNKPTSIANELYNQPLICSYYDCHNFKILPFNQHGLFQITFLPSFFIYYGPSILLDATLKIEYYFNSVELEELKDAILYCAKDAHNEFMETLTKREDLDVLKSFLPQYREHLLKQKLDLHLQSSFFGVQLSRL